MSAYKINYINLLLSIYVQGYVYNHINTKQKLHYVHMDVFNIKRNLLNLQTNSKI